LYFLPLPQKHAALRGYDIQGSHGAVSREIVLRLTLNVRAMSASGSPSISPPNRLALLMQGELRFTAELHAPRFGPLPAFAGAGPDEIALELG
jgi:hypothetical protein